MMTVLDPVDEIDETTATPAEEGLLDLLDTYQRMLDIKDELAERVKRNNAAVEQARNALAEAMVNAETPKITRGGYSYTLQEKTKYSTKAGMADALMEALREAGLGDLIKETVNAQSLQGAMRDQAEQNEGELPAEFAECVNAYSYLDIGRRRATTKKTK